jgi:hypothetical protein
VWFHAWMHDDRVEIRTAHRALTTLVAAVLLAALLVLAVPVLGRLGPQAADASPSQLLPGLFGTTTQPKPTTTTKPKPKTPVPAVTFVASPIGEIPTYDGPGGKAIGKAGYFFGYSQTMPIVGRQVVNKVVWLKIQVPERPNGKTAWVQESRVKVGSTPYRIVLHRDTTTLTVFKDGWPAFSMPAGIGKSSTPTPLGNFYVAVIERPGPHGYGPVVLDTSGHSEAIQSWQGAGDAIIAAHGPISSSSDAKIGSTGTYISNGCIRLHEADQIKLDVIPLGTPFDIVP